MNIRNNFKFGLENIISFLLTFSVISTILGTIIVFCKIKWNIIVLVCIVLISMYLSYLVKDIFKLETKKQKWILILLIICLGAVYSKYSPVLEVRQDPSVYMMKSMNLIDYGTTYAPTDNLNSLINNSILDAEDYNGYGSILNGTMHEDYGLETDFYAGGTFINASLGLINKDLSFYGVTIIAILIGVVLYYILMRNKFFSKHVYLAAALVITFMISPVNTWFFRGTYSEGISCLYFLLMLYSFSKIEKLTLQNIAWIILVSTASYFARIDYIIIVLLTIFILTYSNKKYGIIAVASGIITHFICKNTYAIYYSRISDNDFTVIKLAYVLIIISFLMGLVFSYLKDKRNILSIENIIIHKHFKKLLLLLVLVIVVISFRSMLPEQYLEMTTIHEQYMRTYNEEIFNRFYMVFPSIVIILGVFNLPRLFLNNDFKINSKIFLMGVFIPYCYYLYDSGNSPQLYWNLRRYIYIILPVIFISFIYCLNYINAKMVKYVVGATLLLMINLQINSRQVVEFQGILDSVKKFESNYCQNNAVFLYDDNLKYDLSSVISYTKNEFIPVKNQEDIYRIYENLRNKEVYYITSENINLPAEKINISYERMGEDYDQLPKEVQTKDLSMSMICLNNVMNNEIDTTDTIYPNNNAITTGFYDNESWSKGIINIYTNVAKKSNEYLVVNQNNYDNPLSDEDKLQMKVNINDVDLQLEKISKDKKKYYFKIPEEIENINTVIINTNTFNPKKEGINDDDRDLGAAIQNIYISDEVPSVDIYPSNHSKVIGFYDGENWTKGNVSIITSEKIDRDSYLVLKRCGYDNPLIKRNQLDIKLYINDFETSLASEDENKLYFKIPSNVTTINKIDISTNTFVPKDEGLNGDERALGLDIKSIYVVDSKGN